MLGRKVHIGYTLGHRIEYLEGADQLISRKVLDVEASAGAFSDYPGNFFFKWIGRIAGDELEFLDAFGNRRSRQGRHRPRGSHRTHEGPAFHRVPPCSIRYVDRD